MAKEAGRPNNQVRTCCDGFGRTRCSEILPNEFPRWSLEFGDCQTGDPDLHKYIGELYYKGSLRYLVPFSHNSASHQRADIISHIDTDGQFVQAEQHLVASCKRDAAVMLAEMAYEWQVLMTSGR